MLAVQGPQARAALGRLADAELPARMRTAELELAGAELLVCGTGYTGEDGCERDRARRRRRRVGRAPGRGRQPRGPRGARRCAWRSASTCTATISTRSTTRSRRGSAGAASSTPASSAPTRSGAHARADARPVRLHGTRHPRQGNPIRTEHGDGVVTSGSLSPCLEIGIGMGYVPLAASEPGTTIEVDVRGKLRSAEVRRETLYERPAPENETMADASYPDDLKYHEERLGAHRGRPGDLRRHLVRAGRARRGRLRSAGGGRGVTKDQTYAESNRSRPSATSSRRSRVRSSRSTRTSATGASMRTPTARAG